MDKESKEVREKIAQAADFIGAIRLPNNTFKGIANTEVVTDIVFLQKRAEGQGANGADSGSLSYRERLSFPGRSGQRKGACKPVFH